jgi:hypothetical protein
LIHTLEKSLRCRAHIPADFQPARPQCRGHRAQETLIPSLAVFDSQDPRGHVGVLGRQQIRPTDQRVQIAGELAFIFPRPTGIIAIQLFELFNRAQLAAVVAENEPILRHALLDGARVHRVGGRIAADLKELGFLATGA